MKTIHYGTDYCKVVIGSDEYELPIAIGKAIDRANKKLSFLRRQNKVNGELLTQYKIAESPDEAVRLSRNAVRRRDK